MEGKFSSALAQRLNRRCLFVVFLYISSQIHSTGYRPDAFFLRFFVESASLHHRFTAPLLVHPRNACAPFLPRRRKERKRLLIIRWQIWCPSSRSRYSGVLGLRASTTRETGFFFVCSSHLLASLFFSRSLSSSPDVTQIRGHY